ncbi:MAG: polysaccharide pyruvyl transferase family protein, partial [Thermoanaerobaculia bacterium]|nr:polysaccharide pyruvyl transferase family protein [Thermoanaerobaculia bacterium]
MHLGLIYSKSANFGDLLNEDLFAYLGFDVHWACTKSAEAAGIGSILGWLVKDQQFSGLVLGSGLIDRSHEFDASKAEFRLVRGPRTLERIRGLQSCPMGDPGILASHLYSRSRRRWRVGLAPHYQDIDHPAVLRLRDQVGVKFIDVRRRPQEVAREISACDHVLASSLHAIITADSYQVPSTWMVFSELRGGTFKFHDYFLGIGYDREPLTYDADHGLLALLAAGAIAPREKLLSRQEEVLDILRRAAIRLVGLKVHRKL